ncbi:MAG TPA: ATP-dependent zinc metalloprotease FtsH [Ktedonobacterales bacterium]
MLNPRIRTRPVPDNSGAPSRRPWWQSPVLWLLVALVLTGGLVSGVLGSIQQANQRVVYSTFVRQVNANNVRSVTITGYDITGVFKTPVPSTNGQRSITDFSTTLPAFGDPELLTLLSQHDVTVDVQPANTGSVILTILGLVGPLILLVLLGRWALMRRASPQGGIFSFGRSRARLQIGGTTGVTFADVAGADEVKAELVEVVDFLKQPDRYTHLGGKLPKGVLLVGPPGTGKTLLARAVAGEAGVPFFAMSASEFVEMLVGVGASRVRDLFERAKQASPCIIYIDELDAIGRQRGGIGASSEEREQTLNQILVEMDGFDPRQAVIVLGSTNRPDVLDAALLRPGRFDRQVVVNRPDRVGREAILRVHTRGVPIASDVDLGAIARSTPGMVGADLANLVNEAALAAARKNGNQVTQACFDEALDRILMGALRPLVLTPEERRVTAYHEAGHALVALHTPGADPVRKVTIVPRGQTLGVTRMAPADERHSYSHQYLLVLLATMLGGRVAEQLVLEDVTTGAENDLQRATMIAREMVTRWGMSERVGAVFLAGEREVFLGRDGSASAGQEAAISERTAALVDEEIQRIISERYAAAQRLLQRYRDQLEQIAQALLDREVVTEEELLEIAGRAETIAEPTSSADLTASDGAASQPEDSPTEAQQAPQTSQRAAQKRRAASAQR